MIEPLLSDDKFLADVDRAVEDPRRCNIWWLGQSGFLIKWRTHYLLFDPYLSDSLTKKYAGTDKPHERMTRRVVDPRRLGFVDVVTSSHNHTDHLDAETLLPILEANPQLQIVVPTANRQFAADRLSLPPSRLQVLDAGQHLELNPFMIHAIPAAHETIEQDENGYHRYLGYMVTFGEFCIYHSGDTMLYEGLEEWLMPMSIDLALLPINGRAPERRVAGNLNASEAARLARRINTRQVIPCHYDMFYFNTSSPEPFAEACMSLEQPYAILQTDSG